MAPHPEHGPGSVPSFVWAQFAHSQATDGASNASVGIVGTEIRGGVLLVDYFRRVCVTPLTNDLQEPSRPTYRWNRLRKRTNTMLSKTVADVEFEEKREAWCT